MSCSHDIDETEHCEVCWLESATGFEDEDDAEVGRRRQIRRQRRTLKMITWGSRKD